MNLTLKNTDLLHDGIFGQLLDEKGSLLCYTLQHAYDAGLGNGTYAPKVGSGTYRCVRGLHRLASMVNQFETFEITGVKGHTNILFHQGNHQDDSEGCVLLGRDLDLEHSAIWNSHVAFSKFMELQKDINEFTLTVLTKE